MTKKEKVLTTTTEQYCDMCGKMISDGLHNGVGWTSFWGTYISLKKEEAEKVEMKLGPSYGASLLIEFHARRRTEKSWEVCRRCADKVAAFIEREMTEETLT